MLKRMLAWMTVLAGLSGCALLDEPQRHWIFQPGAHGHPARIGAAQGLAQVWIGFQPAGATAPVALHGLWLPQPDPAAPALLYLHGARWDVRSGADRMRRLHALGFAVLGIDYRGFGASSPLLPSQASVVEDAHAAWDWLHAQRPQARRYVHGHSLGAAVAVLLAAEVGPEASGLIVEGGFTSIADVFATFPLGWLPARPFITQPLDAGRRIGELRVPVLVVHGSDDRIIAPALGRALYERAPEPRRFVLVPGGRHHDADAVGREQYREAVTELFGIGLPATALGTPEAGVVQSAP